MDLREHRAINVERGFPTEVSEEIQKLDSQAYMEWASDRWDDAFDSYMRYLEFLNTLQQKEGRAIHKGVPLYMLGLLHFYKGNIEESFKFCTLAYIEDLLGTEPGQEDQVDSAPAGTILSGLFGINKRFVEKLKESVYDKKFLDKWTAQFRPENIYEQAIQNYQQNNTRKRLYDRSNPSIKIDIQKLIKKRKFEFNWEKRVFVGGSYIFQRDILYVIEEIVRRKGFEPVMVLRYELPDSNLINHHRLMMLHTCRLAIFEMSSAGGHYLEIGRVNEYGINTLALYKEDALEWKSEMILSMGGRIKWKSYKPHESDSRYEDLRKKIEYFLLNPCMD